MSEWEKKKSVPPPIFRPGIYRMRYELSVREAPGLLTPRSRSLVPGSLKQGRIPAGTEAELLEIRRLSVSVWGKCVYGWICLYMNGRSLAVPVVTDQ